MVSTASDAVEAVTPLASPFPPVERPDQSPAFTMVPPRPSIGDGQPLTPSAGDYTLVPSSSRKRRVSVAELVLQFEALSDGSPPSYYALTGSHPPGSPPSCHSPNPDCPAASPAHDFASLTRIHRSPPVPPPAPPLRSFLRLCDSPSAYVILAHRPRPPADSASVSTIASVTTAQSNAAEWRALAARVDAAVHVEALGGEECIGAHLKEAADPVSQGGCDLTFWEQRQLRLMEGRMGNKQPGVAVQSVTEYSIPE